MQSGLRAVCPLVERVFRGEHPGVVRELWMYVPILK